MKALILDDEYTAVKYLAKLIQRHCPQITEILTETSVAAAELVLNQVGVDILFTDIEMDEQSGIDFVASIDRNSRPAVVFTTAYNQYAIEAFRNNAIDYLLKPIEPKELVESVERAVSSTSVLNSERLLEAMKQLPNGSVSKISIADGQDYHLVDSDDIIRVEGSGSYSKFYLSGGIELQASRGLKFFEAKLQALGFIRTHQSHLVNMAHAIKYSKSEGGQLFLIDGHRVPVSSRLKSEVQGAFGL